MLPARVAAVPGSTFQVADGGRSRNLESGIWNLELSALPAWLLPVASGLVAGLLLAGIMTWVFGGSGRQKSGTADKTPPDAQSRTKVTDAGAGNAGTTTAPKDRFGSIEPPSPLGVTADKLVLWNHHNGPHNDRGTAKCNVRLFRGGREVWSKSGLEMPWAPNEDRNVTLPLPQERFDRVRVEITKWHHHGGGLAEIEVISGLRNLALGCPARATAQYSPRYLADRVTDGVTESPGDTGYLLPDGAAGWVEVDLSSPRPREPAGVMADKLVIWNQHNGPPNNSGTHTCDVTLYSGERAVWQKAGVELPWKGSQDLNLTLKLPAVKFDRVRVAVTPREGQWGGLAEVEMFRGEKNLALGCPTRDSGTLDEWRRGNRVTDGIPTSEVDSVGYWLLPHQGPGWVEIDLACLDPQFGAANRRLGEHLALVEGDWQRGLAWLARGDDGELRLLARVDSEIDGETAEQVALGDAWWDLAAQADGKIKERLLARSLWRYRQALNKLHE